MAAMKKGFLLCYLVCSFHIIIILGGAQAQAQAQVVPIRVGVVLDMDRHGETALTCISMALSDFYATHSYYNTRLTLVTRDSKGDVVGAAAAGLEVMKNVQVQAILGPTYSVQANFLISLGDKAHVPIITFSATSPSLSSIPTPYFIRTTLNDSSQVDAIGAIVEAFGWREVVPIYEENEFGEGIIPYLTDALEGVNARVPYRSVVSPNATDDQIATELYKLMTMQTRVFVVHMMSRLASRLFTKANQIGMMSWDYAWIVTDGLTIELDFMDSKVKESMLGIIGVRPYVPDTKALDDFRIRFENTVPQNSSQPIRHEVNMFNLWAYDSAIALAMAAEEARLTNPKYVVANSSTNFTDLEAFGVSDAGPNLTQALSRTKFQGLAGDFSLVDGQLQAPPFEIINMVGPGARRIGYWTKEDGIVKELNSNVPNRNSTSKSNLGSIIWPGDTTIPPKGWVTPTNGKKLRVGVPVKSSFTNFLDVTWNPDNSTNVGGYCIEVFEATMAALPYGVPYEYIPFTTPDHNMAGSYNELVYQVYLGKVDAVAGDVTIVASRSQFVDFTLPYMQSAVSMVVPFRDDKNKNAWVFLKPLTWELWLTSFCSFVFIGFLIWVLEHRINKDFRGPFWYQVGMIFWFAFSTMVFAQKETVIGNLARFVLIIWFLVVLILTQSYTASLASMLTVQKLTPTVNNVNDLITSKQMVGYKYGSFVYDLLKRMNFDDGHLKPFNTSEQMDELLSKGSANGGVAAAFHEDPYLKVFLGTYGSKYTMVGPLYKADGFGFVFPIGSPLVPDVSRAILQVTEGEKIVEIERKWLGDISKYPDCSALNSSPKNLGLASFWGLFMIVGIAGAVALTIFVIRFLRENWDVVEGEDTLRNKAVDLLQRFNEKDHNSHTFNDSKCAGKVSPSRISPHQTPFASPLSLHTAGPSCPTSAPSSPIAATSRPGGSQIQLSNNFIDSPRGT